MNNKRDLTAPCGLGCFVCDIYEENLTEKTAEFIHQKMGIPKEEIPCKGCRQQDGKHFHLSSEGCATLNCAREKGVEFCCECTDFPCSLLAPLADGAERYPHNMKLFNLCRIKKAGIDRWIEEEAGDIRKKYFTYKFIVGRGQEE
ncbi:MAG: DUF3795 domain-containing protein [Candidatus Zixiibacteriota bacterium]|nr:MAG: DUF3795 domain-containing protein [candidate division Zixibacteria bacterium]